MIIPMTTTGRPQQRYDHRLRDLVQGTGEVTIGTDLGIPRSTARGWLGKAPRNVAPIPWIQLENWKFETHRRPWNLHSDWSHRTVVLEPPTMKCGTGEC